MIPRENKQEINAALQAQAKAVQAQQNPWTHPMLKEAQNATYNHPIERYKFISSNEGQTVPYPYVDTKGNVTTLDGQLIRNPQEMIKLQFMDRTTNQPVTPEVATQSWNSLKQEALRLMEPGGKMNYGAEHFKDKTNLYLPKALGPHLARKRIDENDAYLSKKFPTYNTWGEKGKAAMSDMVYNIGIGKLNKEKWPKLYSALQANDLSTAANEVSRKDVGPDRNAAVRKLLLEEYQEQQMKQKPQTPNAFTGLLSP